MNVLGPLDLSHIKVPTDMAAYRRQKIAAGQLVEKDGGNSIPVSQLKAIDAGEVQKASNEFLEILKRGDQAMYREAIIPAKGQYAEVIVNGKSVATVDNSGGVTTANNFPLNVRDLMASVEGGGPQAAQQTAENIAKAMGGEVVKLSTAKTQTEWNNREKTTWKLNTERLERHGHEVSEDMQAKRFSSSLLANQTLADLLGYSEI